VVGNEKRKSDLIEMIGAGYVDLVPLKRQPVSCAKKGPRIYQIVISR